LLSLLVLCFFVSVFLTSFGPPSDPVLISAVVPEPATGFLGMRKILSSSANANGHGVFSSFAAAIDGAFYANS
jgi:hypothetical protein